MTMSEIALEALYEAAGSVPDPEIRKTMGELGMIDEIVVEEGGRVLALPPYLSIMPLSICYHHW